MTTRLIFDEARKAYGGSKNGLENEYANFVYRGKTPLRGQPKYNPDEAVNLLLPAIEALKEERAKLLSIDQFVPPWAMFGTWINQQRWTKECRAKKIAEQQSAQMDETNYIEARDFLVNWVMEQPLDGLYEWSKCQSNLYKRVVAGLRPEIIEYAKRKG
jgi:hypothetical protein